MTSNSFKPVLYVKENCPFCLKVRLFLLEAGLLDAVEIRAFAPGSTREDEIRAELAGHIEKVSFPAAQVAPGEYLTDSDAIIARFAAKWQRDPAHLPVLQTYVEGPFKQLLRLWTENRELKAKVA